MYTKMVEVKLIWNLVFLFAGFFLIALLLIVFISKKRLNTVENNIFLILGIVNFIGYISEILLQFSVRGLNTEHIVIIALSKIYLVYILVWMGVFSIYTFLVSNKSKTGKEKVHYIRSDIYKNMRMIHIIIIILTSLLTFFLPISIFYEGDSMYSYGTSVGFLKIILVGYVSLWIIRLMINFKTIKEKQYYAILTVIVLLCVNVVLQTINPTVLIATFTMTFTTFVLFFTIENPDLQLLNEMKLAKEDAEKANNAKSEFITNMSHEIRTPLNAIIAFSEEMKLETTLEEAQKDAKQVIKSSKILLEIVGGILDISKIESGKVEITNDIYSTEELFDTIISLINIKMEEKNLKFNIKIASDLPIRLYGDKTNIQKILMNLLSNAYKYTTEGKVDFTVDCINKNGVCRLIMAVEDTGRGIKTENIDKLFTKFNRLDEDKNTTTEGTGLGLAITKKLIEMMGGKVTVQSVYGSGSKFTVILDQQIKTATPIISNEAFNNIHSSASNQTLKDEYTIIEKDEEQIVYADYSNKTILAIDDSKLNLNIIEKLLRHYKLKLVKSMSAVNTLEKIYNGENFDLLLMDIEMPIKKGTQIMQELKQIGYKSPIVAWTANATSGDREKYIKAGFDDYISKPTNRNELDKLLNKFFSSNELNSNTVFDATTDIITNDISISLNKPIVKEEETIPKLQVISNQGKIEFLKNYGANIDKAIEILGDMEMYNDIMKDFLNDFPEKIAKMKEYKESNDMKNYAIHVHGLKSNLKYIGFYNIADIAYNHEIASKENNISYINENYDELIMQINKIAEICKEYLRK